ncbi:SLAP domain-containing protein [Clostridium thailandense]|uniref:SLAP domain-containing protein n=1 Tax=Clostridium thailandense TaxID=2794346 RepID=UPI00398A1115
MVKKTQKNEENKIEADNKEYVPTVLSLLDKDENVVSDVQKEIFEEEIQELPPIEEGQLNISGIYVYDLGKKFETKVYIRNGLSDDLKLGNIPLLIINSKGETLARQVFNLESLGTLPPRSARPLKLYFDKANVNVESIPADDWSIVLDGKFDVTATIKPIFEGLPEDIDLEDKLVFDKFLEELPELKEGEFSISTFSIGIQKDGNILVTCVMRNATSRPMSIDKVPVTVLDAEKRIVKSNLFKLKDFSINSGRARICNFAFPTNVRPEEDVALEDWTVAYQLPKVNKK